MKKAKNVIFDCDGVLVNSEMIANRCEAEYKTELGFPTSTQDNILKFMGLGMTDPLVQEELKRLPKNYWEIIDQRTKKAYEKELRTFEHVGTVVKNLEHPKCVASSSHPEWLDYKLTLVGLKDYFSNAIFSGHSVAKSKPAPDLFHYAVAKMGWIEDECLVIEDSVAGVTAGKAARMTVCAYIGGDHILPAYPEKLIAAGADYVISDFRNLIRLLA